MSSLNDLIEQGRALGFEGQELREFLKEQQDGLRDERQVLREQERAEREMALATEKAKYELEVAREKTKLKQLEHMQQVELLAKQAEYKEKLGYSVSKDTPYQSPKSPKIPAFDEKTDEMDSYLGMFERYATAQNWKVDLWATNLSALLKGKALDVYALMPIDQALDYESLKSALLKRFDKTEEGFKSRFRSCRPELGENFVQCSVRLSSYFKRWVEMSKIDNSYDALFDFMVRDQFLFMCNRDLTMFLLERKPKSMNEMAALADQYREARFTSAQSLCGKTKQSTGVHSESKSVHFEPAKKQSNATNVQKRCYKCGKMGHIASECAPRGRGGGREVGAVHGRGRGRGSSRDSPGREQTQVCGACTLYTQTGSQTRVSSGNSTTPTTSFAYKQREAISMPLVSGFVESQPVIALRDTGCSGIVVKQAKVPVEKLTGELQTIVLADGSKIESPVAVIDIDTPYLVGTFNAWCLEEPTYELIIGNVPGARSPSEPDQGWNGIHAVETRQQAREKGKPYTRLKVPEIIRECVTPDDIKKAQQDDQTLSRICQLVKDVKETTSGKARFFLKGGLIFREFKSDTVEDGNVYTQLVVPKPYRIMVMKLAHDSLMAGHLGTRKTVLRVLSEFYWPGVQADTKRYCQSCDICQRTVAKGKVTKVPLDKMPLIDEPFKRVAVDIIGPVQPITDRGNRYIFTLVDYATRYTEAVALPSIETQRVAEALVDIFSRVGVAKEMLSDMGSQFTSSLMAEVSRLLSMRQMTTTPYHPMCNGLVERFNGTLKQMIKRMCTERPKDWDKYLNAALFAFREVPQDSLGFSPFELVYGWPVRGPMSILKERWSNEVNDPQVKSTYQFVIDLREKLEKTCELARDSLEKSSGRYKRYYDRKSRVRNMKVGDKVLVLLPTNMNKLLMHWKGPYTIVEKLGRVDYRINMDGKIKSFHANLLKQYVERESEQVKCVSVAVIDLADEEEEDTEASLETPSVVRTEWPSRVSLCEELSEEDKLEVRNLLEEFSDVLSDVPGLTDVLEHKINTVTDKPVRVKQYPLPYAMANVVSEEVSKMLDQGFIEPSESAYCSPSVIVKKKDGSNRFCIDMRAVNRVTVFDAEPMPNAEDMFAQFAGYRCFSKLDLSKGYWQIPLEESSKCKTAFQTPKGGLFQFKVMAFGLVTAAATFTRMMRKVLKGITNVDNFIDDIIIFTMTFVQHLVILRAVLTALRQAKLTAKPSKCSIGYRNIECLGHFIGDERLKPHPEKVKAIEAAERPRTKKQVRSFLGLIGFYRKFVPNFSSIALPLTDSTKKGQPNQTDASEKGIGSVLFQYESDNRMPVAYASRKLKASEINYSTIEKECLAIVWAVQKFAKYLYGREFVLETDHQPLAYLNTAKVANARLMRWALILQPYRFTLVAIKGSENVGADYLSRV